MSGILNIDGIDVQVTYGVYLLEGYCSEVLRYPSLKQPEINDWHEEDGIEVDLVNPTLEAKELSLSFFAKSKSGMHDFIGILTTGSVHQFSFTELGVTLSLRVSGVANTSIVGQTINFELQLSEDLPGKDYIYLAPTSSAQDEGYKIDALNIAKYGLIFLQGTQAAIAKPAAPKQNLTVNLKGKSGVSYDGATVKLQSKEIAIPCLMRASTGSQFIINYKALLYDLIRSGARSLTVLGADRVLPFYYKSSNVDYIDLTAGGWCKFSLTIVIIKP